MKKSMKQFKFLSAGDTFTLPGDDAEYVKLGNEGARVIEDGRIKHDTHCIPGLFDQCYKTGNTADGLRRR